jgi:hypothetical protein
MRPGNSGEGQLKTEQRNEINLNSFQPLVCKELYESNALYKASIDLIPVAEYSNSALNSLKHGMNMDKLLPCRQHSCYYRDLCEFVQTGDVIYTDYGSACPIELAWYLHLSEGYALEFAERQHEEDLAGKLSTLIMERIKSNRVAGMMALEGGIFPRPGIPSWNYKGLSLSYRYGESTRYRQMNSILDILGNNEV